MGTFSLISDACELAMDPNTAHRNLFLSDNNRKVISLREEQPYPDQPERFNHWRQLLCQTGLTGRCYWEVERKGEVHIAVTYKGIMRRGDGDGCLLGRNDWSWSLKCSDDGYFASHKNKVTTVRHPSSAVSNRVAVYVDCPGGTLSFYRVSSDSLIHLHTFNTTFTEPVYPAFGFRPELKFGCFGTSVSLCQL